MRWIIPLILATTPVLGNLESHLVAQTWTPTSAPTNIWTAVACSADGNNLVAAAANGSIYLSTNSGASWRPSSVLASNLLAVCSSADGNTLAASAYGVIYVSKNAGLTWGSNGVGLPSLACSADGTKMFTIGDSQLFVSADSGTNWTDLSLKVVAVGFGFLSIASSADGNTSLIAEYGQGNVWFESHSNPSAGWGPLIASGILGQGYDTSLASSADGKKLAAYVDNFLADGGGGSIYISADGGTNWTAKVTSASDFTSLASSADGTRLVAVASGDTSYVSVNSGADWISVKAPVTNWVSVASSADGNKLVAAVRGGGIYTMQTKPTPILEVIPSTVTTLISWIIPSQSLVLQQTPNIATAIWTDVPITPALNLTNLHNEVTVTASQGNMFYRLVSQLPSPKTRLIKVQKPGRNQKARN